MLSRIGPYPIEREVGRGGMGVVYLGRDPRLDRPVAIKVLPDAFARDPDRLARFEREARLLAALTHPNIAGIYGIEEADGRRFLALEYVEGETLAQHLARGPLPVAETLDVCGQIAAALEAAHEAGIVHRDLKPGNVKLTPDGKVKVLDFGLAKGAAAGGDSVPDLTQSPTMTHAATAAGVILGTAAYMSPEQARGKPVDRRTDIWSFGCVLYECLTGAQAFAGETASDMIALILQGEPDAAKLPRETPDKLRVLLARCLEKDARRRLRDIGDARIEIEEMQGARPASASRLGDSGALPAAAAAAGRARGPAWRRAALAAVTLAAGLATGIGLASWGAGSRPDPVAVRFTLAPPPAIRFLGDPNEHAVSPDGRSLVFAAVDSSGRQSLWLRPLARFEAKELPGTRNGFLPFWSPDSRQVGFFADGKLKKIRVDGGSPEVICDAANGRGATWGRKDVIVFGPAPTGPLFQVRAGGGNPAAVTALDTAQHETAHRWPCFLPDGEHFTYAALPTKQGEFACYVGSLRSMERDELFIAATAPTYAAPGHLIFTRNEALMAQRFDARRRKLAGDPFRIGDPPAATTYSGAPCASVSASGVLAWQSAGKLNTRLVWLDRDGRETGTVGLPPDRWGLLILSHDGRRAMVEQDVARGDVDLWVIDLEREVANRITFGQGKNTVGTWSPDGREILYSSTRNGPRDIFRRAADGSGTDQPFHRSAVPFKDAVSWSPDGRWVLFHEIEDETGWNLLRLPAAGGAPEPFLVTPFNEQFGAISPDGRWVLYTSDETGTQQLYVQSFPEPGHKQQVTKTGAVYGVWANAGREILLLRPDGTVVSVPVEPGPEPRFGAPSELYRSPPDTRGWDVSPDGRRFLVTIPAELRTPGISVAVNWREGTGP